MAKKKNPDDRNDQFIGSELDANIEGSWFVEDEKELTGNYSVTGERDPNELIEKNHRGHFDGDKNSNQGGSEKMNNDENQNVENIDQIENQTSEPIIDEVTKKVSDAYDALDSALTEKDNLTIKSAYVAVLKAGEERHDVEILNDKEEIVSKLIDGPLEMTSRKSDLLYTHNETLLNLIEDPTKVELSEDEQNRNYDVANAFFVGSPVLYDTLSPKSVSKFVEAGKVKIENSEEWSDVLDYFKGVSDDAVDQINNLRKEQALEYESREDNYKRSVSNLGVRNKSLGYFLAAMTVAAGVGIGGWIYNAKTSVDPNVINEAKTELRLTSQDLDNERKMYSQDKKNYEDRLNGVLTALGSEEGANPVDEATKLKISYDNSQETLDTLKENLSLEEDDDLVETINEIQTKVNNSWEAKITTNIADQTALLGVVDAYRNSLGGAIAVKGKSCDEALSNLYNAMTPENQNVELKNEFVKNATTLCGEIDPNKSYVLFGKRE